MTDMALQSVLIACNHNALRSPMAAALLRRIVGMRLYVRSAGVSPRPMDPFMIAAMDEVDIDMRGHVPRTFAELADGSFDLIVSLAPQAQHAAVEMTRVMACDVEYWPTADPSAVEGTRDVRMDAYRALRDDLDARLRTRFGGLIEA